MLHALRYNVTTTVKKISPQNVQVRAFWEYVNMKFNSPDADRIKQLGPDRVCAEWVLRNGGKIVWEDGKKLTDYNFLPPEKQAVRKVLEIDGTDSSISHYGFPHLIGCTKLRKIILHNNNYICDRAMKGLEYGANTLSHVQVSQCANVTDSGLKALIALTKLDTLVLFNLTSVKDLEGCKGYLRQHLPNCKIGGADNEVKEKLSN